MHPDYIRRQTERTLAGFWIYDSIACEKPQVMFRSGLVGLSARDSLFFSNRVLNVVAPKASLQWRFWIGAFHQNDETGEQWVNHAICEDLPRGNSIELMDRLYDRMDEYLDKLREDEYVTYGWVAVCHDSIDLEATTPQFIEVMSRHHIFDRESVAQSRQIRKLSAATRDLK